MVDTRCAILRASWIVRRAFPCWPPGMESGDSRSVASMDPLIGPYVTESVLELEARCLGLAILVVLVTVPVMAA